MANNNVALEFSIIHKSFGEHEVLKGIDLIAHEHDVISIIGSSGSGKSTFLRCVDLLESPTDCEIDGRLQRKEFVKAYYPLEAAGGRNSAIAWTTSASVVAVIEMV